MRSRTSTKSHNDTNKVNRARRNNAFGNDKIDGDTLKLVVPLFLYMRRQDAQVTVRNERGLNIPI